MSLLTLDLGNTSLSACFFANNNKINLGQIGKGSLTAKSREQVLNQSELSKKDWKQMEGAMISSVVPGYKSRLLKLLPDQLEEKNYRFLSYQNSPLPLEVKKERQVGSDIIANAVGAWEKYQSATLIVDFGTATTIDLVAEAAYQGSVIAPNLSASLQQLVDSTALLNKQELRTPNSIIGKTTKSALDAGFVRGFKHLIEGLIADVKQEREVKQIVATGQASPELRQAIDPIDDYDPLLTHKGLKAAWFSINDS